MLKASIKVLTQSDSPVRSQSHNLLPVKREKERENSHYSQNLRL